MSSMASNNSALAIAISIISLAFIVASFFSERCTQLHCSRILATSTNDGFTPQRLSSFFHVGPCNLGEQAATTTFSIPCSLMAVSISTCPGSEHVYVLT